MTHRHGTATALLLTAALHLALLFALLSPARRTDAPRTPGAAILWLVPAAPPPQSTQLTQPAPHQPPAAASAKPATRPQHQAAVQPEARDRAQLPARLAAPTPAAPAAPIADDLFAAPPTATGVAQLLRMPAHGAGMVDRELRGGKAVPLASGGNVLQGKLEIAFREAAARKWHDPATIQEISTPSSRVRVYKMTTMSGTVCISIPDPSMEKTYRYTVTNCPRENERGDVSAAIAQQPGRQP